ncbi:cytochrome P450 [Cynara cardunculus var. scolymus]|uniref:Cytochrome P450 n=1 Tax=Cynara cardunculus var. scolymus TaxID=59895 RepID=A0A103YLY3_CYNCS|nr:cytochrome P450 [Cynara cardunculus var. scolymus]
MEWGKRFWQVAVKDEGGLIVFPSIDLLLYNILTSLLEELQASLHLHIEVSLLPFFHYFSESLQYPPSPKSHWDLSVLSYTRNQRSVPANQDPKLIDLLHQAILCSITLLPPFKFFHKFWWIPMNIKLALTPRGIQGPPYSFIHGNTKEISNMRKKSMSLPIDTSHYIFPRVQPHMDSWFFIYVWCYFRHCFMIYAGFKTFLLSAGKNFVYWHGPVAMLVVSEPVILKEIMSNREISMGKQDMGPIIKKMVGEGLISSKGDKWAKQRKIVNHAFHAERLNNEQPTIFHASTDDVVEKDEDKG